MELKNIVGDASTEYFPSRAGRRGRVITRKDQSASDKNSKMALAMDA